VQSDVIDGIQGPTVSTQIGEKLVALRAALPAGYTVALAGAAADSSAAEASIAANVPLVLFIVFTLLMLQLHSFSRALLVFLSAVSYAVYLSYSGEMVQRLGSLRLVGLATSVACLLCLLQFAVLRPLDAALAVAPQVLWLSVLNATICTVVPVLMVMMAIERIGSALAAQVGMVGPMSTMLMGVMLLGEPFTAWLVAGTLLVLAGVFVCSHSRA